MLGSIPLAELAIAAIVGKRMAVAGEPKAHRASGSGFDAMLFAVAKLYGLFEDGTTGAAHGTVILADARHTGEPSTFASDLDDHVKVYVGLSVAPMAAEHIAHLDIGLRAWYHLHVAGLDAATATQVLAIDAEVVAVAADVGDLVYGIGRQSFAVG